MKASSEVADSEVWKNLNSSHGPWHHPLYREGFYRLATEETLAEHHRRADEYNAEAGGSEGEDEGPEAGEDDRDELEGDASGADDQQEGEAQEEASTSAPANRTTRRRGRTTASRPAASKGKGKGKERADPPSRAAGKHKRSPSAEDKDTEGSATKKASARASKKPRRDGPPQLPVAYYPGARVPDRKVSPPFADITRELADRSCSALAARIGTASSTRTCPGATTAFSSAVVATSRGPSRSRSGMTGGGVRPG